MTTALLVVLLVLVVALGVFQVASIARGCPFALLWLATGGLELLGKAIVGLLEAIAEAANQ